MTTTTRYIDTAATAGGDGTTENHSGATRAYASMSEWEAGEQGTVGAGDIHEVLCSGSSADTTKVTIDGWTISDVGGLRIRGNRAANDNDGFFDSYLEWSTSHYRLSTSGSSDYFTLTITDPKVRVDGIQVENPGTNGGRAAVYIDPTTNGSNTDLRYNRIRANGGIADSTGIRKFGTNGGATGVKIKFNIISNCTHGIRIDGGFFADTSANTYDIYNNIIRDCSTLGLLTTNASGYGDMTINATNNAFFDNGEDLSHGTSGTVDYNAGEDADVYGTTNGVDIGGTPWSDDFAGATDSNPDYEPQSGGDIDGSGIGPSSDSEVLSTDLKGNSISGSTCTIGPFEVQASGASGSGALTLSGATIAGTGAQPHEATAALALANATISANGAHAITATAALALMAAQLSATGLQAMTSTAALALANAVLSATGAQAMPGSAAITLANAVLSAAGEMPISGSAALALANAVLAASGQMPMEGTAALALANAALAASGEMPMEGTAALALANAALAASGEMPMAGTAALALANATVAASGDASTDGSAAITLANAVIAASGEMPYSATAALILAAAVLSAAGLQVIVANAGNTIKVLARNESVAVDSRGDGVTVLSRGQSVTLKGAGRTIKVQSRNQTVTLDS